MDNGHQHQGAIFSNSAASEPSDNLNEKDWQRSLEISAPADLPTPETLQEKANNFFTPENTVGNFPNSQENEPIEGQPDANNQLGADVALSENQPPEIPVNPQELGQIISTSAPSATPAPEKRNFNTANIRTTGDRLEKSTIPEIDNAITELSQTGNLNNFYDEIRGEGSMLDVNLSNSFNRKLGGDQSAGGKG